MLCEAPRHAPTFGIGPVDNHVGIAPNIMNPQILFLFIHTCGKLRVGATGKKILAGSARELLPEGVSQMQI